jgi:hypothetical protein
VLVASANTILPGHIAEVPRAVDRKDGSLIGGSEIWRRKMEQFNRTDHLVDSASSLFAYPESSHKVCHSLVSRANSVDEPVHRDNWLSWIGHFDAVAEDLYKHRVSMDREILMDKCIR